MVRESRTHGAPARRCCCRSRRCSCRSRRNFFRHGNSKSSWQVQLSTRYLHLYLSLYLHLYLHLYLYLCLYLCL